MLQLGSKLWNERMLGESSLFQEFIAVSQLNKSVQGKILCFVGPPGKHDVSLVILYVVCQECIGPQGLSWQYSSN